MKATKPGREIRHGGGVYVYRTRKPGSLIAFLRLPWWVPLAAGVVAGGILFALGGPWWIALGSILLTGRHFAYVGETVSFRDRHGEHVAGGGRWNRRAQPWSDLDPACVARIPLPTWKPLLRSIESLLIFFLMPVYNVKKNKWNPRRIPLTSARRMRRRRDRRSVRWNLPTPRIVHVLMLIAAFVVAHSSGVL